MPGFKRGQVPNPNYERNDVNQFSQITEFTNDVDIYGTLYTDIEAADINFDELVEFNDVAIKNDLIVGNNFGFLESWSLACSIWFRYKWASPKVCMNSPAFKLQTFAIIIVSKEYEAMLKGTPKKISALLWYSWQDNLLLDM